MDKMFLKIQESDWIEKMLDNIENKITKNQIMSYFGDDVGLIVLQYYK